MFFHPKGDQPLAENFEVEVEVEVEVEKGLTTKEAKGTKVNHKR